MRILHGEEVQRIETEPLSQESGSSETVILWWFTACSPYSGERHDLCPGDITLRNDYHGSCICPCHKL